MGLYVIAVALLGYFNLSVLSLSSTLHAEERARTVAAKVVAKVGELTPYDEPNPLGVLSQSQAALAEEIEKYPELRYLEVLTVSGGIRLRLGSKAGEVPVLNEALATVRETRFPYECLIGYEGPGDEVGRRLDRIQSGQGRRNSYEIFTPILVPGVAEPTGVLHVSIDIPATPLRTRLVALVNLVLGATFLITSLMALNLWAEHAIHRPLRGLTEAMGTLDRRLDDQEFLSANELVNISKSFNRMALDLVKYQRELEQKTTNLEQANENYRVLNEQLEQKVEEKTREMKEFFSLVTHDLRIPLAAIQGYTDLLERRKDPLTERQSKFVRAVAVANSHALELVRNLLEAMKYEFGQPQMVFCEFDLKELADEVVSHLEVQADDKELEVDLPAEPVTLEADRTRIKRVLTNLIGNALRHSEKGQTVTLKVRLYEDQAEFEVVDRGPGIAEEHLDLLFEKFTQFPSQDGPSSGLGLGLYIVGKILEGHHTRARVSSQVGEGTTFSFLLPLRQNEAEPPRKEG